MPPEARPHNGSNRIVLSQSNVYFFFFCTTIDSKSALSFISASISAMMGLRYGTSYIN